MTDVRPVRRALVAVFDKDGVVELARELSALGVELVSSGGTAATIAAAGIDVTPVETVTGFPEMLDGRIKTLHPRVHGGLLADRRLPDHRRQLVEAGIAASSDANQPATAASYAAVCANASAASSRRSSSERPPSAPMACRTSP